MSYRPRLMIRTAAAEQTPVPAELMAILGQPTDPDPEDPEANIAVQPDNVADYFKRHRDHMPPVERHMVIWEAGDRTAMFPDGYDEEFIFPAIMADRIPGTTAREKQQNREALKAIFDAMTSGAGASWVGRYLSTVPEQQAYINLLPEEEGI